MYKGENLFATISSTLPITTILCKLIRKLYSSQEIQDGVPQNEEDERFDILKSNISCSTL